MSDTNVKLATARTKWTIDKIQSLIDGCKNVILDSGVVKLPADVAASLLTVIGQVELFTEGRSDEKRLVETYFAIGDVAEQVPQPGAMRSKPPTLEDVEPVPLEKQPREPDDHSRRE